MTALVTGLGLLPIAIGSGEAGREIEGPMAWVIVGGLVTSTVLNRCGEMGQARAARPEHRGKAFVAPAEHQLWPPRHFLDLLEVLPMRDHHDAVSRGDAEERHEANQRTHVVRLPRGSAHLIEEARDRKPRFWA